MSREVAALEQAIAAKSLKEQEMTTRNSYDLSGRVAFVTGGGTGIGRGIADAYIDAGAAVVVGGRRPGPLEDFCSRHGERAAMVRVDIGDDDARQRAIDFVIARFGRLDILVNNALAVYDRPFAEMTSKQIDITYRILLTAPTRLAQIALPHLIASESGCIINISSASARYTTHPITGLAVYSAAKAGINQLTRALASELGPLGVRVNAIAPGPTKVEAQDENTPSVNAATEATPLGRLGLPEDIAGVALFLASPAASWVTGQVIDATGGWGICG